MWRNIINTIRIKIRRIEASFDKFEDKHEISLFYKGHDLFSKSIVNILNDVKKNKCSNEERKWIDKIEMLRSSLNTSSDKISIRDYGARSPSLNLTAEEMYKGINTVTTVGKVCRNASKSYKWDLLLFKLIREFKPSVCLELGTSLGISAAYQAAACEMNNHGRIVTLEGSESIVSLAVKNFENIGIDRISVVPGRFQDTLLDVLNQNGLIDFVFVDGHHDEYATLNYFRQILPHLSNNAILIFDDINWSGGMARAWDAIHQDRNIKLSVDLFDLGICFFTKNNMGKNKYVKASI